MNSISRALLVLSSALFLSACDVSQYFDQVVTLGRSSADKTTFVGKVDFTTQYYQVQFERVCSTPIIGYDSSGTTEKRGADGSVSIHVGYNDIPVYGPMSCENVPHKLPTRTTTVSSLITIKLNGTNGHPELIKSVSLGLDANNKIEKDAAKNDSKVKDLAGNGVVGSRVAVVVAAKGLKVASNALNLPTGFKPGQAINLEIDLDRSEASDAVLSGVGTKVALPQRFTEVQEK